MTKQNTIKTILEYRKQKAVQVFEQKGRRRSNEEISFTRHLIKYFLYVWNGYSSTTIERHMRRLGTGFHHASVLHSRDIVIAQSPVFSVMISDIYSLLIKKQ